MSKINLNDSGEYGATDVRIFNDGKTGVVSGVTVRITKKGPENPVDSPDYKVYVKDKMGEINEGYYYQDNEDAPGWKKYQGQRLIRLAKGILGESFVFPEYDTPKDALDGVMKLLASNLKGSFRVAVTYGTTRRPSQYLGFKSYGRFIENEELFPETKLTLDGRYDQLVRLVPETDETIKDTLGLEDNGKSSEEPAWLREDSND